MAAKKEEPKPAREEKPGRGPLHEERHYRQDSNDEPSKHSKVPGREPDQSPRGGKPADQNQDSKNKK